VLVREEYRAPAHPSAVLAALREAAVSKNWTVEEEHPGWFFCVEAGQSVRQEPRKLAVFAEEYRLETKIRLVVWCSGFTIRRYDGKVDLIPALPYECRRLTKAEAADEPLPLGSTGRGPRGASWVEWTRFAEFGLLALSIVAVVFFAVAMARHMPTWSAGVGLAVAALASLGSGLVLDLVARRTLKIVSRSGMQAQLRRAGMSAAVAVVLLVWLWKM
jgi:hypothetical protein